MLLASGRERWTLSVVQSRDRDGRWATMALRAVHRKGMRKLVPDDPEAVPGVRPAAVYS